MFRCELTDELSNPGEKPVKVTLKSRTKTYLNRVKNDEDRYEEVVSTGTEIVKEVTIREKNKHLIETL